MKKILQISNYFYPHIGGIESVTRNIADALSSAGQYDHKVLCFNEDAGCGSGVCRRRETTHDRVDGVEVIRCGCVGKFASQSLSFTFGNTLKSVLADFDPDVVIFHYPNPLEAHYLLRFLKADCRLVVYWHLDIVKQRILGRLFQRQSIRLLERAQHVIATSPLYAEGSPYLRQFRAKCRIIPNCIRETRLTATDAVLRKAEKIRRDHAGKILCFAIGRHVPYKGLDKLVKASKLLDDRFRIFIGGQGELTGRLKAEAAGDGKIVFTGPLSDEDLNSYYAAADIFCFPSITKNEAFGIALAEGMYWGKPTVTFHIPGSGVNYVSLAGECGLEVPNGDCGAYAGAMRTLADDPAMRTRMGQTGAARVRALFLKSRFHTNILEFLRSVFAGPPAP